MVTTHEPTTHGPAKGHPPQAGAPPTVRDLLVAAEDRMELTERGWIEKVVHPARGRASARVIALLLRLGVPEDDIYDNTRLTPDPDGLRYIPDLMVILPANPTPAQDDADYAGAPDLAVEILSPGDANRQRDLEEKRRRYALRGIPHYWIVDPQMREVTWLRLREGAYAEQWTRPLAAVELPWR